MEHDPLRELGEPGGGTARRGAPHLPLTEEQEGVLTRWLDAYVTAPHPELGRDGPVCPFVRPAIRVGALHTARVVWRGGGLAEMERHALAALDHFVDHAETGGKDALDSLIVVVDGLERNDFRLIDEAHRVVKDRAVAEGLMLGQMHPECPAPSARNPFFPVNRAPCPLYVVRRMAFHDILFLHDNPVWFEKYRSRYGRHYRSPDRVDPSFVRLFDLGALIAAGGSLV